MIMGVFLFFLKVDHKSKWKRNIKNLSKINLISMIFFNFCIHFRNKIDHTTNSSMNWIPPLYI